jgi:hypothetical protein
VPPRRVVGVVGCRRFFCVSCRGVSWGSPPTSPAAALELCAFLGLIMRYNCCATHPRGAAALVVATSFVSLRVPSVCGPLSLCARSIVWRRAT